MQFCLGCIDFAISTTENVIEFEKEKGRMSEQEAVAAWHQQAITGGLPVAF